MLKRITFILLLLVIVLLVFFGSYNIYCAFVPKTLNPNEIGDSAGLLNSIFSGLALLGVIITIYLQSKELKQTRDELRGQKEQFEIQNKTLKRQQFENTFFNMLKTQENIIYNLEIKIPDGLSYNPVIKKYKDVYGRKVFENLYDILVKKLATFFLYPPFTKENIVSGYASCTELKMLDHYFRHMYRIVKFVKETDFSFCLDDKEDKNKTEEEKKNKIKNEKYQYTSILRATLSPYELVLLFYNCLNEENKFRPLIEEYCLLQNIRSEFLKKETLAYYREKAYGNRYENIKRELGIKKN